MSEWGFGMTCTKFSGAIVCVSPTFRLRLADGRCVFMDWHNYLGPTFFSDKACVRLIAEWYGDALISDALGWFCERGHRA